MRVVFAGTPPAAVPALEAVLRSRHDLVAVVTRPDAPAGRGRRLVASAVADATARLTASGSPTGGGVEVLKPRSPKDPEFLRRLAELAPDCAPIVAYGGLIPKVALDIPRHGWVNLHFSLLPAWRGAAPVQHALIAGDEVTGASTFLLEEGLDTGPVFGVTTEPIRPTDTAGDLLDRLAHSGAALLVATLDGIEDGTLRPRPQPPEGVSHAPRIGVEDARISWAAPALHVDRLVRGCTPAPGAWTIFRGERIKIRPVRLDPAGPRLAPGRLAADRGAVHVGTGSHPVVLGEVLPPGRRPMPAADWARGTRLDADSRFEQ